MAFSTNPTSNDLLFRLELKHPPELANYTVIAQSTAEIQDIQNSPSVSMGPYLIDSEQTRLLTTLSIYSLRGDRREQARLLYMNATALRIWKDMGRQPTPIGSQHRPPRDALLSFGVPFSE
jgi:hypothetical protein